MAEIVYPYKKYNYKVLIDQKEAAGFSEVSAADVTAEPVEYREGNMAGQTPGKQPGLMKYSNVIFKRGITSSTVLSDWMKEVQQGKITRKTVVISLLGDDMKEVASWQLERAWPTKYTLPDLNATSSEAAIESLELVLEGITRTK